MFSHLEEQLEGIFSLLAIISFLWGVIQCFAGYKLFRILMVIMGVFLGGVLGFFITRDTAGTILGAVLGGVLLWYFYLAAIFVAGMILGFLLFFLLIILTGSANYTDFSIIGLILGIAGGVLALYWHKFIIVLSTAFYGAFIVATWLVFLKTQIVMGAEQSPGMLIIVTLFLGFLGMLVQYGKLDGLFKGGKTLADLKITSEDIHQDRKITPETMEENLEEFKRIKEVFQHPEKYRNKTHTPSQPYPTPTSGALDYQTQKVATPGAQIPSVALLQLSGNYKQRRYKINWRPAPSGFEALVGKATANNFPDVNIPESVISRKHVLLKHKNGQLFIVHLSATNPTYKNNQPLQANTDYPLQKGDKLILGDIHFKVE